MNAEAKGAECCTHIPLESAPPDEYGYVLGETLSARLVRLDGDLAEFRGTIGAHDEPRGEPASIGKPEPDWCTLTLDALATLEALLVSHAAVVPYGTARAAVDLLRNEQNELAEALRQVVAKHNALPAEWTDALGLGVTLTAMQAAQLDPLLRTIDKPLSLWEVCGSTLLILASLLIPLAIYLLNLFITKPRDPLNKLSC